MRRIVQLLIVVLLAVGLAGLGPAASIAKSPTDIVKENPGAAVGAGAGAATGAIAGAVLGKSAGSAVIGGLLGALAGGAIGHYAYDRSKDREQTAKDLNFQPSDGNTIKVENVTASPQTVKPGSEVNLKTTYGLLTPSEENSEVTEKWEITHNGRLVGNPEVRSRRADGTYNATMPLRLPENAKPGVYEVRSTVKTDVGSDSKSTRFRVG